MATSEYAKIEFENGQTFYDYTAMTDSGDNTVFTVSGGTIISKHEDYSPYIRPNGIVTGRNVLSTNTTADTVTISAFTAYSCGTLHTVSATIGTINRPATAVAKVNSITMNSSGAIAVVAGTDGSTNSFSSTRGAAGGPPEIPADSVEIGQVRVTSDSSAKIEISEIYQTVGTHAERYDYPSFTINYLGDGDEASVSAKKNAYIEFASALPQIHTDSATKNVYIKFYAPVLTDVGKTLDFVPAEKSHSVSSTQYYNGIDATVSSSIGQASFTARMDDNITDSLLSVKDKTIVVRFYPNRNKSPYILSQGKLGISRSFPVSDQNQASVTVSTEVASVSFSS